MLSEKCMGPTETHVQALLDMWILRNISELRSFLGLAMFNSHFIPWFSMLAELLRRLLRNGAKCEFDIDQQKDFDCLKKAMSRANTLAYVNTGAMTKMIADTSPVGLGAVLAQE